jgi:hypothetical protein
MVEIFSYESLTDRYESKLTVDMSEDGVLITIDGDKYAYRVNLDFLHAHTMAAAILAGPWPRTHRPPSNLDPGGTDEPL